MRTIDDWLREVGLEKYVSLFAENEIAVDDLPHLTEADLDRLGLPVGPRRRLLVALQTLTAPTRRPASLTPAAAPTEGLSAAGAVAGSERRQLTVMFCDLVGSTALSTVLDPEELREVIQAYRHACGDAAARYEGHVAQYLGDGLMVYFGWPVAHEDDAERGVRAALEMVEAVKSIRTAQPLSVRIGLATGPVVVGETAQQAGTEARLAVGETPNVAARMQAFAKPDQVVIAPATRKLVGDAFALTDLGKQRLKGIADPVTVWRVDGVRRAGDRFDAARASRALAHLVGREQEMSLLLHRWDRACDGHGQVVCIGGEAGIGKSRLSHVLRERVTTPHAELRYQCSPYHLNSALHPFIEQVEVAAGFTRDDTPEQRLDRLEAAIAGGRDEVAAAAPFLAALLQLPVERYPPLRLSPQKRKERTLEALCAQVATRARTKPVLVVFEDLHWVDPTSKEVLDALVARLASLPVLLIATHRPEWVPPWAGRRYVATLSLTRLERDSAAALVGGVTGGRALPPEVLSRILAQTDGIPLFVEELTQSILESGILREDGDRLTLSGPLPALAIPTSLRDSLAARLDRLGPVKEIALVGACIGREFPRDLLARVATLDAGELAAGLDRLVDAGLISSRSTTTGDVYTFKHALVQDAAYDLLLKSRRQQLHAQIAHALDTEFAARVTGRPEQVAHHHTLAGNLDAAIPLWREAGALAIARVEMQEASAHLAKALALLAQVPPSAARDALELSVRQQVNAASAGIRGWADPEIGVNTEAILRLAKAQGRTESLVVGLWWMWTNTITRGRIAESLPWAERLLAEGEASDDPDLRLFGPAAATVSHFFLGHLDEAARHADRVLSLYDAQRTERFIQLTGHDLKTLVEVWACQRTWMQGFPDRARQVSEAASAHARSVGHAFNLVWALTFGAYAFAFRREPEPLQARVDEADRLAREQGIAFVYEVSVPQIAGLAHLHAGRLREATACFRGAIERWTKLGGNVRIPYLKANLAHALALEGDAAAAVKLLDECLEQIARPEFQERIWLAEVLRLKGWALSLLGRDGEAEAHLRSAIDCARSQGARSWELRAATTLAGLLAKRGERDAARETLAPVLASFTEGAGTPDLVEARALLTTIS